ncbi:hypothetical protein Bbelb_128990 [Branchiostoma belcheri]|nr:hypothetical protein Bbelb_128990 [Branchiostoma belcheri]
MRALTGVGFPARLSLLPTTGPARKADSITGLRLQSCTQTGQAACGASGIEGEGGMLSTGPPSPPQRGTPQATHWGPPALLASSPCQATLVITTAVNMGLHQGWHKFSPHNRKGVISPKRLGSELHRAATQALLPCPWTSNINRAATTCWKLFPLSHSFMTLL